MCTTTNVAKMDATAAKTIENSAPDMEEARNALQIFPEEVWQIIFGYLPVHKDIMSCYYACQLFRDCLFDQIRAKALLILTDHFEETYTQIQAVIQDLMSCRVVCKSWKRSVNYCLNSLADKPFSDGYFSVLNITSLGISKAKSKLENFLQRLGSQPKYNPFPGRVLRVHLHLEKDNEISKEALEEFLSTLWTFLENYGKWFWHIYIFGRTDISCSLQFYKMLYKLVHLLPNLRNLRVNVENQEEKTTTENLDDNFLFDKPEIQQFDLENSFPKLQNLRKLKLGGIYNRICQSILRSNSQINSLATDSCAGCKFVQPSVEFPQLTEFEMESASTYVNDRMLDDLQKCQWPLEKVLTGVLVPDCENETMVKLFRTLECFASTLKHVTIGALGECWEEYWRLQLPKLETLRVDFRAEVNLDLFLPSARTLKELYVTVLIAKESIDYEPWNGFVWYKEFGVKAALFESCDIWTDFKRLKTVQIIHQDESHGPLEGWTYTRYGNGKIGMKRLSGFAKWWIKYSNESSDEDSSDEEDSDVEVEVRGTLYHVSV